MTAEYRPASILGIGLMLMLCVWWPGIYLTDLLPKRLVFDLTVGALLVFWLAWMRPGPRLICHSPIMLPAVAYVAVSLMSIGWSTNPLLGWVEGVQLAVQMLLCLCIHQLSDTKSFLSLMKPVAVGCLILSAIGVAQYHGLGFDWIPSAGLPSGTFAFRNMAAAALLGALPLCLLLILETDSDRSRMLGLFAAAAGLLLLVYTRTRGAWLGALSATILAGLLCYLFPAARRSVTGPLSATAKRFRIPALTVLVLLVIGAALPARTSSRVIQTFDEQKASPLGALTSIVSAKGDRGRLSMWENTVEMIADHPFGVGLDNWEIAYPLYDQGSRITGFSAPVRPHNDLLWIASETGLPGLACYLWMFVAGFRIIGRVMRTGTEHEQRLALAFLVGVTALVVHSCFSFLRERPVPSAFLWTYLGGIGWLGRSRSASSRGAVLIPSAGIVIVAAGLVTTGLNTAFYRSYIRAVEDYRRESWAPALEHLQAALALGPFDPRAAFLEGRVLQQLGRAPSAEAAYRRALGGHPNYPNTHLNLGKLQALRGQWADAEQSLRTVIRLRPGSQEARLELSIVYQRSGRLEEAARELNSILREAPAHGIAASDALANLGAVRLQQGNASEAIRCLEQAVEYQPGHVQATHNLAMSYEQDGRTAEAVSAFQRFLQLGASDAAYANQIRRHIRDLTEQMETNRVQTP